MGAGWTLFAEEVFSALLWKLCFQAEIYDTDRVLASVELPFEILRPWYLSYWAVGSYILAGLCLLALLQYLVYRFVKKKKDRVIER